MGRAGVEGVQRWRGLPFREELLALSNSPSFLDGTKARQECAISSKESCSLDEMALSALCWANFAYLQYLSCRSITKAERKEVRIVPGQLLTRQRLL